MNNQQSINPLTFRTPTLQRVQTKAGRFYVLPDGRQVPGCTTILEIVNKPILVHWAASEERKLCVEVAEQTFNALTGEDGAAAFMTGENFRALMTENLGKTKAHYRAMKKAQNIGTEAHAAIEWNIRQLLGQSVGPRPIISDKAELAVMAWDEWAKSVKFEPLGVEFMIYDAFHGYGGCVDLAARINGKYTQLDWKTGKSIYRESFLQSAGYVNAIKRIPGARDVEWQGAIVRLPKDLEDVTETPFEVKIIPESEHRDNFSAFLRALDLFRWVHQIPAPSRSAPRASAVAPIKRWGPPTRPVPAVIPPKPSQTAPGR